MELNKQKKIAYTSLEHFFSESQDSLIGQDIAYQQVVSLGIQGELALAFLAHNETIPNVLTLLINGESFIRQVDRDCHYVINGVKTVSGAILSTEALSYDPRHVFELLNESPQIGESNATETARIAALMHHRIQLLLEDYSDMGVLSPNRKVTLWQRYHRIVSPYKQIAANLQSKSLSGG